MQSALPRELNDGPAPSLGCEALRAASTCGLRFTLCPRGASLLCGICANRRCRRGLCNGYCRRRHRGGRHVLLSSSPGAVRRRALTLRTAYRSSVHRWHALADVVFQVVRAWRSQAFPRARAVKLEVLARGRAEPPGGGRSVGAPFVRRCRSLGAPTSARFRRRAAPGAARCRRRRATDALRGLKHPAAALAALAQVVAGELNSEGWLPQPTRGRPRDGHP